MVRGSIALAGPLLAAILTTGASPPPPKVALAVADPAPTLSVLAPSKSAGAGNGAVFTPAPVPDLDLDGGFSTKPAPARVELSTRFYHERQSTVGDGYTPNSTVDTEQTKRMRPTPTFNLSVPLQ
jgi:hypothetical protein